MMTPAFRRKEINHPQLSTKNSGHNYAAQLGSEHGRRGNCHQPARLYPYLHKRLVEANLKKDTAVIQEVSDLFVELKQGWDTIITKKLAAIPPR
jgi:flagellin-specific chaperone FliS